MVHTKIRVRWAYFQRRRAENTDINLRIICVLENAENRPYNIRMRCVE